MVSASGQECPLHTNLFCLIQQRPQPVEAFLPERSPIGDPALGYGETLGLDAASADPPRLLRAHQSALFQYLQMLHDCGQSNGERLGQLRDRDWAGAQLLHNRPARGIAQSMKNAVDVNSLTQHVPALPVRIELSSRGTK